MKANLSPLLALRGRPDHGFERHALWKRTHKLTHVHDPFLLFAALGCPPPPQTSLGVRRVQAEPVDVLVNKWQVVDDLAAETSLLQHAPAVLVDRMQPLAAMAEPTVVLDEVLTDVQLGAGGLKGAGPVRTRALVVMGAYLCEGDREQSGAPSIWQMGAKV